MTEERFVMEIECGYDESLVRDKQGDLMHIKDCCEMLNDFHKENQDLAHYHDEVLKCLHRTEKDYKEQIKKLHKENEELKDDVYGELDKTLKQLQEIYEEVSSLKTSNKLSTIYDNLRGLMEDIRK